MGTFKDNLGNEYMDPYIPQKIVGFIGIDPDIVGGSGSGGGTGIDDHEQLRNLLGGDNRFGHWHLNGSEYERLVGLVNGGWVATPNGDGYYRLWNSAANPPIPGLDDYIDARIAAYIASQSGSDG